MAHGGVRSHPSHPLGYGHGTLDLYYQKTAFFLLSKVALFILNCQKYFLSNNFVKSRTFFTQILSKVDHLLHIFCQQWTFFTLAIIKKVDRYTHILSDVYSCTLHNLLPRKMTFSEERITYST